MDTPFVLVLLASTTGATECLSIGVRVGETLGRPVQIAHVEVGPGAIILPSQEQLSEYEAEHFAEREKAETEAVRALVSAWNAKAGASLPLEIFKGDEWRVMRHYRGHAALVVLASPHTQPMGHRDTLRAALLRTRHPVVVVPPGWTQGFGRRLVVGWADAPPLHRAIAAFTPFLAKAEAVDVVAVGQDPAVLEKARAVLGPIAPAARYRTVAPEGRRTAHVLLAEARSAQADGLVVGAFRRGEILNWLVPGTSSRLIRETTLPLLMSA
jgi:nucleotide-binding universal stress UspA family protein